MVVWEDHKAAVIDLGLARTSPTDSCLEEDFAMTPGVTSLSYRAPEACIGMEYDAKGESHPDASKTGQSLILEAVPQVERVISECLEK